MSSSYLLTDHENSLFFSSLANRPTQAKWTLVTRAIINTSRDVETCLTAQKCPIVHCTKQSWQEQITGLVPVYSQSYVVIAKLQVSNVAAKIRTQSKSREGLRML